MLLQLQVQRASFDYALPLERSVQDEEELCVALTS